MSETAFKTDFGPQEGPQSQSESAGFWFRALPVVQNYFRKQFCSKVLKNNCSKKNSESFGRGITKIKYRKKTHESKSAGCLVLIETLQKNLEQ